MPPAARNEFFVATIGFEDAEKQVLQSMFGISAGRTPSFSPYTFSRDAKPDLVLLDFDNKRAINGWAAFRKMHGKSGRTPLIAVSRAPVDRLPYVLRRPVIATRLLGTLERVASRELGFQHAHAFDDVTLSGEAARPVPRHLADDPETARRVAAATLLGTATLSELGEASVIGRLGGSGSTVPEAPPELAPGGKVVRALVVDDSLPVRIQMKIALGGVADVVDFAETGEDALRLVEAEDYDLVFLDVILPGIDGYEVCKAIKARPESSETPVIMLTGSTSPADRVRGRLAGCDSYLVKPVRKAVFTDVVREFLGERSAA